MRLITIHKIDKVELLTECLSRRVIKFSIFIFSNPSSVFYNFSNNV